MYLKLRGSVKHLRFRLDNLKTSAELKTPDHLIPYNTNAHITVFSFINDDFMCS